MHCDTAGARDPIASHARVGVVRTRGEYLLVATEPIAAGDDVLSIEGRITDQASRTSVQIGTDLHIDVPEDWDVERVLDACPWRFMNHACEPTVRLCGRRIVALRRIEAWEQITFDYNTTEFDMRFPFTCGCSSRACRRQPVRGFAHLSIEERERLLPMLADHLRARVGRGAPRAPTDG